MDPNACLARINDALLTLSFGWNEDDRLELMGAIDDLHTWIARDGFDPEWEKFPHATGVYIFVTGGC